MQRINNQPLTAVSVAQLSYTGYVNTPKSRTEFALIKVCKAKNSLHHSCFTVPV